MGATVTKVEPPSGDLLATAAPSWYAELAHVAEVVALDLKDAAGRATLEAMETEHEEIDPLLTACTAGFTAMASGADTDTRAALVVRVAAAAARLGQHLGHEETDAMVLVQRHITPAEWEAMHPEFGRHYTAADALFALPWVLHRVPADLRPPVMAFLGRGPTLAWALLLRLPFAVRERWIFAEAGARGGVDA